ncbi:hypothetical protein ACFVHB_36115 [Kitasatospora sp. NPDC127111]|uniref:hypothetical protein n=1 Tax=Kitasatospora sp. NPDC127111 TaxID=3345363 RepID=UPI00363C595C
MTREGNEQPVSNPDINPRLNADLQFKLVSSPPEYTTTTDRPVEYYVTFHADEYPTGLIWFCDEDDAAGYEWWRGLPNENAASFWNEKLWRAKARGLKPSQAIGELLSEPGTRLSGRILPESRSTAPSVAWLAELAVHGVPLGDPVAPRGWRPDPPFSREQAEAAVAAGGWLYQVDDGHDPAGRVPAHAVAGAWQTDTHGRALRFWHNPTYGPAIAPDPEETGAAAVPPLSGGRRPAGRALLGWLADPKAPRVCRITGTPGSGRTHLLTWLAAACPSDNPRTARRVHTLLSADGLTVRSATWLLAARLGLAAGTPEELLEALQDGTPRTLVVTDLDRAGGGLLPDAPERIAAELLAPLARVPWLRLLVECASGSPAAAALHAADPRAAVLDLDDPRWTDHAGFTAWCADLGGTPVDADQVYPSPGLALLPAVTEAWLPELPEEERAAVHALAQAGCPVTLDTWAALPGVGSREAVRRAAARLLPPPDGDAGEWRLRPDHLVAACPPADHTAWTRALATAVPRTGGGLPDFANTDPSLLGLLLRHAVPAGMADQLLSDAAFLVHADPVAVTLAFDHAREHSSPGGEQYALVADAWNLAGPACINAPRPADRAAVLHAHLVGRHQEAADALAAIPGRRWQARWSHQPATGRVRHLVRGHGPDDGYLAYSEHLPVAATGILRFIDPRTGASVPGLGPRRLPEGHHSALLVGEDGGLVLLGRDGAVTSLAPDGAPDSRLAQVLDGITRRSGDGLTAAALAEGADGQVLALGKDNGDVSHIRVEGGLLSGERCHEGPVAAVDLARTEDGLVQISGGIDGTVWTGHHSAPAPARVDARPCPVAAVAAADTPRGLLTAAAWSDGVVRLRLHGRAGADPVDLRLGRPVRDLTATPGGQVCIALPDSILAVELT